MVVARNILPQTPGNRKFGFACKVEEVITQFLAAAYIGQHDPIGMSLGEEFVEAVPLRQGVSNASPAAANARSVFIDFGYFEDLLVP